MPRLWSVSNCENSSESDKLLVNERDSKYHEAVVSDSKVNKADEVSDVRLVWEIDDELDEVSKVHCEVGEVEEADEWRAGWGLWSVRLTIEWWWWLMSWIRLVRWASQYSRKSENLIWRWMITEL